ncbi:MAG: DNA-protecting protein DprA [Alphaproteobacteria bacterium]|nr:MAG: DNA-protecting protein DprA [Alphaproteobacteria bacterium]
MDSGKPVPTLAACSLNDAERLARLRLARSRRVGPMAYRQLIARFGDGAAALDALPVLAARGGARQPLAAYSKASALREMDAIDALGGRLFVLGDADYPRWLATVEDAPPVFTLLGHAHLLARPAIAIVGARNASTNGRRLAESLARGLAADGLVVVSGMARGIDTAAHHGALEGGTIAVLAGGPDHVYPSENAGLYKRIARVGAVVSEHPPGTQPTARHFPRRNRVISGLALGVVVVEAARRSGSLITARLAGEQGREVMAVPGSPLDPRAQGTNALIRDGATLVQDVADVLESVARLLHADAGEPDSPPFALAPVCAAEPDDDARARVLACLSPAPSPIDGIIRDCGLATALVMAILLELELAGRIERSAGGRAALIA